MNPERRDRAGRTVVAAPAPVLLVVGECSTEVAGAPAPAPRGPSAPADLAAPLRALAADPCTALAGWQVIRLGYSAPGVLDPVPFHKLDLCRWRRPRATLRRRSAEYALRSEIRGQHARGARLSHPG